MEKLHRIRFSLLTLVIGSLLGIIGLVIRGPVPLPNIDADAWAKAVTGSSYFMAQVLNIIAYVLPFFGFWALYAFLAKIEKSEKIAFWGFMFSIIGTALSLPTLGIFSFVSPQLAQRYLQGDTQLSEIITQVAIGQPALINISGGVIYLIGTVLLGVAIWRSSLLPKWAGLLLALHGLFLVFGFALFPVLILGWVFLLCCGVWVYFGATKIE
ncbi:MAG: DUF4386 family protein [Anaerolineales bacterium]|nr:DUF4386 family protein [Anaerolineales bacterium]